MAVTTGVTGSTQAPGTSTFGYKPHLTFTELEEVWTEHGGSSATAPIAAAVALAESDGNPRAIGHNSDGTSDWGLWQINSVHGDCATTEIAKNASCAVSISKNGTDWSPWVTFKTGVYKQFLTPANLKAKYRKGGANVSPGEALENIPSSLIPGASWVADLGKILGFIGSSQGWVRIGKVVLGVALLIIAVDQLTKISPGPNTNVKGIATKGKL